MAHVQHTDPVYMGRQALQVKANDHSMHQEQRKYLEAIIILWFAILFNMFIDNFLFYFTSSNKAYYTTTMA